MNQEQTVSLVERDDIVRENRIRLPREDGGRGRLSGFRRSDDGDRPFPDRDGAGVQTDDAPP